MTKTKYKSADILSIMYYTIGMMCADLGKLGFNAVKESQSKECKTYMLLVNFLQISDDPLGLIIAESLTAMRKCMASLDQLDYYIQATSTERPGTIGSQKEKAAMLYHSLLKKSPEQQHPGVLEVYSFIESLPYFIYLLCRIVIYRKIDPNMAFQNNEEGYNSISGYAKFMKTGRPDIAFLHKLSSQLWETSYQITTLMISETKMAS